LAASRLLRDLPVLVLHSPDASVVVAVALAVSRLEAAATAETLGFAGAEEEEADFGARRSPLPEAVVDAAGAAALTGLAAGAVGWNASASAFSFRICGERQH
jgi:hypothetical protein